MYVCISLSLSLYIYIYIYIHMRKGGGKSPLSALHISDLLECKPPDFPVIIGTG